jgi:hypothetical protein
LGEHNKIGEDKEGKKKTMNGGETIRKGENNRKGRTPRKKQIRKEKKKGGRKGKKR